MGDDLEQGAQKGPGARRLSAVNPAAQELEPHSEAGGGLDEAAFGEEFRRFERDVFRLCRRMLDSSAAADDAVGAVYLSARRGLESFDRERPFRPWLLGIAGNYCIDQLRRRQVETRIFDGAETDPEGPIDPGPSPLKQVAQAEQRAQVLAAVDALPIHHRLPLMLRYWSELDYEQIGEILGVPRGQVGSLLFRARRQLRRTLPDHTRRGSER